MVVSRSLLPSEDSSDSEDKLPNTLGASRREEQPASPRAWLKTARDQGHVAQKLLGPHGSKVVVAVDAKAGTYPPIAGCSVSKLDCQASPGKGPAGRPWEHSQ